MKKSKDFLSLLDSIKSELKNLKEEFENYDKNIDPNSNVLRASMKKKSSVNKKDTILKNDKTFKSTEGKSIMTTSLEGKSIETNSMEGKSLMNYSIEGNTLEKRELKKVLEKNLNEKDEKNKIKEKVKDKKNFKEAMLFYEILSKPKSLK